MPTQPFFSRIFARSPIAPIQHHMKIAGDAAIRLKAYLHAVMLGDWAQAGTYGAEIVQLEHQADDVKRRIRSTLSPGLFMPVSRSDLLDLLQTQDRIPNRAKDIVELCAARKMEIPAPLRPTMREFVQTSLEAVSIATTVLEELDELFESGFSGTEVSLISAMISKLNYAEHEADEKQAEVQDLLYKMEKQLDPVDVVFLYRLIEWIDDIADNAQKVGNRMLYLTAKSN